MTTFLSQLTRFKFLCRFWPWKELLRLQMQCHANWENTEACLAYLNQIEPSVKHVCFDGRIYFIGGNYVNQVQYVPNPRMNAKADGFDA